MTVGSASDLDRRPRLAPIARSGSAARSASASQSTGSSGSSLRPDARVLEQVVDQPPHALGAVDRVVDELVGVASSRPR